MPGLLVSIRRSLLVLKHILDREGIPAQILDTAELKPAGRANLYARLKGDGTKEAIDVLRYAQGTRVTP